MSTPAIQLQAVYKSFRRTEVLRGVTLTVEPGRTFAFLGRNAAGKTTTIRMLLGLLKRNGGAIRVLGLDPETEPLASHVFEGSEGVRGTCQLETDDGAAQVIDFYEDRLQEAGYEVTVNRFSSSDGEEGGVVNAEHGASGRSVVVMVGTESGQTTASVSYSEEP